MKKKIIITCLIAIGIFAGYKGSQYLYGLHLSSYMHHLYNSRPSISMKVSMTEERTAYSHLGTDITIRHTCNGRTIKDGDTVTVSSSPLIIETTITESDSVPDSDSGSVYFEFPLCSGGGTRSTSITVRENGGRRYKDAFATWYLTYKLEPIPDNYWGVVFYF